ncbi:hypothetical protein NG799_14495 [Laspinema sp. D1]|uniref:Uncharacterized protein n=1 Tax=Laspinema palackyanum D2a TaxID=2953684 RepID=A0ABT2MSN5_9CYAN|nr:hypothetical protein [Laspinema sp. D2a]
MRGHNQSELLPHSNPNQGLSRWVKNLPIHQVSAEYPDYSQVSRMWVGTVGEPKDPKLAGFTLPFEIFTLNVEAIRS